ncbi:MAG: hypothetical protein LBH73_06400, partial [Spirochaetaceae bacterium]|nr:hypothetical protein [Spirochaetaceae bacterium]
PVHGGVSGSFEGLDDDLSLLGAPFVDGTFRLRDWLSASFSMFIYGSTKYPSAGYNVPGTYSPFPDLVSDTSDIGPIKILQDWTSALTIGTSDFYFQAGLIRSSFGPLYDNGVIVGPQAARTGHFSVNYRRPTWSFEMLWLELVATPSARTEDRRFPDKHFVSHVFTFKPKPELELSFIESVVWGGRIEPLYLLPFNQLFAAQSMADFGDNSFMGILLRWSFAHNAKVLGQFYVDDFHFNDIIRLHINSKYKLAGELGLVWAPEKGPFRSLSVDYTAVFPYMYTHMRSLDSATYDDRYPGQLNKDGSSKRSYTGQPNYLDYSHAGKNLGVDLDPNTDRVTLRALLRAHPSLDITLLGYFSRHGNASDNRIASGLMNGNYHDGSIFDDGNNDGEWDTTPGALTPTPAPGAEAGNYDNNYSYLRFLIQPYLETKLAGGVNLSWRLPTAIGDFSFNIEYLAEYCWNRNLIPENNSLVHYWSVGGSYRY